jgi:beta-N-acetylhexosaminidase
VGAGDGGDRDDAGPAGSPAGDRKERAEALPLERQVGSLLLMSYDGTEVPGYILRRLRNGEGSGVIVFGPNAPDADTLKAATRSMQRAAGGGALVATDQEGGDIRSAAFAPPEPSPSALTTPAAVTAAARDGARALRDLGVNVNLAPVADVSQVPGSVVAGRAFPGDAETVAGLVVRAVKASDREEVATTLKHFPGLGGATENTDDVSVTIDTTRDGLEDVDLNPFQAGISAGAPLVMMSHALYPALDGDSIASQSGPVIQDLLRDEMGFGGAVITDSLEAQAVLDRSGVGEAAERSVQAGVDLVLMTGSGSWNEVYPRLLRRARRDPAFRSRVAESAGRVIALKRRLGLPAGG